MQSQATAPAIGRRVVVVGPSGSGKNTVAQHVAAHLGVRWLDLDAVHWEPGWHASASEVFRVRLHSILLGQEMRSGWAIAGNYFSHGRDLTWDGAETIVWLDLPLHVTLPRLLVRSWRRAHSSRLLWGTNHERFWPHLKLWSRAPREGLTWNTESLLAWNLRTYRRRRREMTEAMRDPRWRHLRFVRIRSRRGVEAFLRDLGAHPRR